MVTTNFVLVWNLDELPASSDAPRLRLAFSTYTPSSLISACVVQLPQSSYYLAARLSGDDIAALEAAFSVVCRSRGNLGTDQLTNDVLTRRRAFPPSNTATYHLYMAPSYNTALHPSPNVVRILCAPSGRGVALSTQTYYDQNPLWMTTSHLVMFDFLRRSPVTGGISSNAGPAERSELRMNPAERVVGPLFTGGDQVQGTALAYDDAKGRIVIGTSNGTIRIMEYL